MNPRKDIANAHPEVKRLRVATITFTAACAVDHTVSSVERRKASRTDPMAEGVGSDRRIRHLDKSR